MKNKKKIMVVLLALLMMALSAIPVNAASVYTPVHPTSISPKIQLTVSGTTVVPNVTYTFTTVGTLTGYSEGGVDYFYPADVTANAGVYPAGTVLGTIDFTTADTLTSGKVEKSFTVNLSGLTFTQPGIYYYTVSKTASGAGYDPTPGAVSATNENSTHYIWIRVVDEVGVLKIDSVRASNNAAGTVKISHIDDQYPAVQNTLTVSKAVSGPLASKDQYFKFTVDIAGLGAIAGSSLSVSGNTAAPAPILGEVIAAGDHPTSIPIDSSGNASAVFWLKDGEHISVEGLLVGATYSVAEVDANTNGYVTTYDQDASGTSTAYTAAVTGTINTTKASSVAFSNTKTSGVPTGVWLQTAAPVAGIVVAAGLLVILLAMKRRKKNEASC